MISVIVFMLILSTDQQLVRVIRRWLTLGTSNQWFEDEGGKCRDGGEVWEGVGGGWGGDGGREREGRWWWRSLSMHLFLPLSNLLRTFLLKPRMAPNRRDIRQLQTIPRILQPLVAVIV
jgi:hypothetical protein